jgi:hypothetical protein
MQGTWPKESDIIQYSYLANYSRRTDEEEAWLQNLRTRYPKAALMVPVPRETREAYSARILEQEL